MLWCPQDKESGLQDNGHHFLVDRQVAIGISPASLSVAAQA